MSGTYHTIKKMENEGALLVYSGEVNPDIISRLLQLAEDKLDALEITGGVRKRVFHILVECLQNLYHHAETVVVPGNNLPSRDSVVQLRRDDEAFYVETGNYLLTAVKEKLTDHLSKINSLSKEQVREYYKNIMTDNGFTAKGGAGLGFIDIARKSEEPLQYNFIDLSNDVCFFEFSAKIKI